MDFGARALGSDGVQFRLWAPSCDEVQLELLTPGGQSLLSREAMLNLSNGWHERLVPQARAAQLYRYRLSDGLAVPDPASRYNPHDVHGPSEVIDPAAYQWRTTEWRGRPWHTAVVYELHLGTFTAEGTLSAALSRLPQLLALGITAIELMPVAGFPGTRGWGYDGVLPFAVDASYGRPEDLKRFVDSAHGLGLMVLLDVVYNHLGPDGNYLHVYCAHFFDPGRQTPWGPAINVDGPDSATVRQYFTDNALFWLQEYRLDGLRLDAVHAIDDQSGCHLVAQIADAVRRGPGQDRRVHLVLENDRNTARWLLRDVAGEPLVATAQWNDDLHHAAHVLVTGETDGYYADYADAPAKHLGCSLAAGFVYQGQPSVLRGGERRGEPSALLPSQAFVSFLQNHDQIGNRALGERLDALASIEHVEALLACVLLSPHIPMLFMGEEFAATTPFLYFCDFPEELAAAVVVGRRQEFAGFPAFRDAQARERIPDPGAQATFDASKLRWEECDSPRGQRRLALVAHLLALRRQHLTPLLPLQRHGGQLLHAGAGWFSVEWSVGREVVWSLRANFSAEPVALVADAGELTLYRTGDEAAATREASAGDRLQLGPHQVHVALRRRRAP